MNVIQFRPPEPKQKTSDKSKKQGKVLQYPVRYKVIEEQWFTGQPPFGSGTYSPPPPYENDPD